MAGICVERLPHETCGSVDSLQVFYENEKYTGYCFNCKTYVPDPYKDAPKDYKPKVKIKSKEMIKKEKEEIASCPTVDLPDRKLREDSLSYFGVKVGLSQKDGKTPRIVFFPYQDKDFETFKARLLTEKAMWWVDYKKKLPPFGWDQAKKTGAKKLFITEGEFDTIALYQILKDSNKGTKWESYEPAVVSLPYGVSNIDTYLLSWQEEILRFFQEIVYVKDMDKTGEDAAQKLVKVWPDVKVASLPCKDANACLIEGRSKAAKAAVMFSASSPKNSSIVYGSSLKTAAKKRPEFGLSWPWEGLTKATRGIRRGETIYFGAGVKMGKSEVVNALGAHLIDHHDLPVFFVKPEEAVNKTYQRLVGKVAGRIFHDPNIPFDEAAFDKAEPRVGNKALILDLYQFISWESLKSDIRYVVKSEGVKDVFIDPITCLTNQMGVAEANENLVAMTAELSAMAKDLDFTAYIFCHLKAPSSGEPHERGGQVLSHQFAGSRAMMRSCNYMIGIEGNKNPELPLEKRNLRSIVLLEDREFGCTGKFQLYWDHHTGMFNEVQNES